ncbi:cell division protein PerM [Mariniluteicoccus endophyticus]
MRSTDDSDSSVRSSTASPEPSLPWFVTSMLAGVGGALGGWCIVAGVVVVGWLLAQTGALGSALAAATQIWLLTNGGGLVLDGQRITLVPLGLTALLSLLLSGLVQGAARQAVVADEALGLDLDHTDRGRIARNVALVAGGAYAVCVTLAATIVGTSNQGARALVGSVVIGLLVSWLSACRGTAYRVSEDLPPWAAPLLGALRAGVLCVVGGGAAALAVTLWLKRAQVAELYAAVAPDPVSGGAFTLLQLCYLPNLVMWGASYVLGAGFGLGEGSIVSPANTDLGLIPGIPVLGALPVEGSGSWLTLAWMAVGVVAGALAAAVVVRRRSRARFDETAVVGGLAGLLVAVVVLLLALVTRGDLGDGRLVGLGPRLPELAMLGGSVMGLSGLAVGLVLGIFRRPGAEDQPQEQSVEDQTTEAGAGSDELVETDPENGASATEEADEADESTREVVNGPVDEPTCLVVESVEPTRRVSARGPAEARPAEVEPAGNETVGVDSAGDEPAEGEPAEDEPTRPVDAGPRLDDEPTIQVDEPTIQVDEPTVRVDEPQIDGGRDDERGDGRPRRRGLGRLWRR